MTTSTQKRDELAGTKVNGTNTTTNINDFYANGTTTTHKDTVYTQRSSMKLSEILDLPIALLSVPIVAFMAILTGPFRARKQKLNPQQTIARSLLLHVGYSIFRRVISRMSPLQIQ